MEVERRIARPIEEAQDELRRFRNFDIRCDGITSDSLPLDDIGSPWERSSADSADEAAAAMRTVLSRPED